jgi:peptidoglycan/xylan/chitin deacetylase (PgdA/CDA1 family)
VDPILVVSISLELIWGYINAGNDTYVSLLRRDSSSGRRAVYELLGILDEYGIPATWAVVGHLLLDQCDKIDGTAHPDMPRFKENWYDADPCTNIRQDPLFYGRDIVERIMLSKVNHEIGYHSFSHVIFSQCSEEVADAEIAKGLELARKEYGLSLRSFIFPQNKAGHTDILRKYGFKAYRGENLWRAPHPVPSARRPLQRVINSVTAHPAKPYWEAGVLNIPTSMLFGAYRLPTVPIRARLGLSDTIRNGGVFHISMHPQDLSKSNLLKKQLRTFFTYVDNKRKRKELDVLTMGELAIHFRNHEKVTSQQQDKTDSDYR